MGKYSDCHIILKMTLLYRSGLKNEVSDIENREFNLQ